MPHRSLAVQSTAHANAYAERLIGSIRSECLDQLVPFDATTRLPGGSGNPGPKLLGGPDGMYRRTVRGEIRIPSLTRGSAAIRSSPQVRFAAAIVAINCCKSAGIVGRLGDHDLTSLCDRRERLRLRPSHGCGLEWHWISLAFQPAAERS